MSAPTNTTTAAIPTQRNSEPASSARWHWPSPTPAGRVWMAGDGHLELHRVEQWRRAPSGRIHARCGRAAALIWLEATYTPRLAARAHCLHCEDPDDAL